MLVFFFSNHNSVSFGLCSSYSQTEQLNLSNNKIEGTIPSQISQLSQLVSLHLEDNQLTGTIPYVLTELDNLGK